MAGGTWMITYVLEGDLNQVRVPQPNQKPDVADNLWRHTCCEAFVARQGHTAYHEFNFSPSGDWALYAFSRPRERAALGPAIDRQQLAPHVTVCRNQEKLELDAVLHLDRLSPLYTDARLALGLSAVVEELDGSLSYWALKHALDKPDFHHPDTFVLELDEVRH